MSLASLQGIRFAFAFSLELESIINQGEALRQLVQSWLFPVVCSTSGSLTLGNSTVGLWLAVRGSSGPPPGLLSSSSMGCQNQYSANPCSPVRKKHPQAITSLHPYLSAFYFPHCLITG